MAQFPPKSHLNATNVALETRWLKKRIQMRQTTNAIRREAQED